MALDGFPADSLPLPQCRAQVALRCCAWCRGSTLSACHLVAWRATAPNGRMFVPQKLLLDLVSLQGGSF